MSCAEDFKELTVGQELFSRLGIFAVKEYLGGGR